MEALGLGLIEGTFNYYQAERNRKLQERQNKADREFQKYMYDLERQHALEDFTRGNEYNHPLQQMARLRQAGLNPNLVYGKGAETTAVQIRGSQPGGTPLVAPKNDFRLQGLGHLFNESLSTHQQIEQSQAQTDLLNKQASLAIKEGTLKDATTAKTLQDTATSQFELKKAQELKDLVVEKAKLDNLQTKAETQYRVDENERQKLSNTANVKKTLVEIETAKLQQAKTTQETEQIKQNLKLLQQDELVKQVEVELARVGVLKSDPLYYRLFMQSLAQKEREKIYKNHSPNLQHKKRFQQP